VHEHATGGSRTAYAGLGLVAFLTVLLLIGLGLWGTRWTVPAASPRGAAYSLAGVWDGEDSPDGPLQQPIGIAVSPNGDVYVTDATPRVVHFGPAGDVRRQWGRQGSGAGEFGNPVGLAVGLDGAVYVSDYEHDRIQKFSASGEFLLAFGRSGSSLGELSAPAGLAVDADGLVYVAEFYNHRIQKLREDTSLAQGIGRSGRLGAGALHYPTGIAITAGGELLVADAYNYQLHWFDRTGQALRRVGYHLFWLWPRPVSSTAGFFVPTGVAAGADGLIHVADSGNHRVVMLSADGEYLTHWRIPDPDPGVYGPSHLAVSPDGSTVYATDPGGNRVLILEVARPR
jgi:DNA-binding beta-propeller fold protein YncE